MAQLSVAIVGQNSALIEEFTRILRDYKVYPFYFKEAKYLDSLGVSEKIDIVICDILSWTIEADNFLKKSQSATSLVLHYDIKTQSLLNAFQSNPGNVVSFLNTEVNLRQQLSTVVLNRSNLAKSIHQQLRLEHEKQMIIQKGQNDTIELFQAKNHLQFEKKIEASLVELKEVFSTQSINFLEALTFYFNGLFREQDFYIFSSDNYQLKMEFQSKQGAMASLGTVKVAGLDQAKTQEMVVNLLLNSTKISKWLSHSIYDEKTNNTYFVAMKENQCTPFVWRSIFSRLTQVLNGNRVNNKKAQNVYDLMQEIDDSYWDLREVDFRYYYISLKPLMNWVIKNDTKRFRWKSFYLMLKIKFQEMTDPGLVAFDFWGTEGIIVKISLAEVSSFIPRLKSFMSNIEVEDYINAGDSIVRRFKFYSFIPMPAKSSLFFKDKLGGFVNEGYQQGLNNKFLTSTRKQQARSFEV